MLLKLYLNIRSANIIPIKISCVSFSLNCDEDLLSMCVYRPLNEFYHISFSRSLYFFLAFSKNRQPYWMNEWHSHTIQKQSIKCIPILTQTHITLYVSTSECKIENNRHSIHISTLDSSKREMEWELEIEKHKSGGKKSIERILMCAVYTITL